MISPNSGNLDDKLIRADRRERLLVRAEQRAAVLNDLEDRRFLLSFTAANKQPSLGTQLRRPDSVFDPVSIRQSDKYT